MEKLKLSDLCERTDWKEAVIVFTQDSFNKKYTVEPRSYKVYRYDGKYFKSGMLGKSLLGYCLDGTDKGVRLDWYLGEWKIDYCYIVK